MAGFVQRFLCLSGDAGSPERSPQTLRNAYADSARSKILMAVEQDLNDAFSRIPHPVAPAGEQSLAYARLSTHDLSPSFLFLARDLLGKIGALVRTCEICQQDQVELLETLQALELAHRRSEFARARAEALATARGEALMHAQAATRDAEAQQLQLSALLQTTLEHLGCAPSPTPAKAGARTSLRDGRMGVEGPTAELTLAGPLDASLDPQRRGPAAPAAVRSGASGREDDDSAGQTRSAQLRMLRASVEGSLASLAAGRPQGRGYASADRKGDEVRASHSHFSGFTVHTNDLAPGAPPSRGAQGVHSSLVPGSGDGHLALGPRASGAAGPPEADAPRSSVGWRGIASALRSSVRAEARAHRSIDLGQGPQDTPLAPAWTPAAHAGAGSEAWAGEREAWAGDAWAREREAQPSDAWEEELETLPGAAPSQRPAPLVLPGDGPALAGRGSFRGKATTSLLPLGTFLSPTLEGMARWKGARPGVNPRDHIAAVFRNTEDLDFYHPFSAGMHGELRPASHQQHRSVSNSNAQALPHATENGLGGRAEKEARAGAQGGGIPLQGRNM